MEGRLMPTRRRPPASKLNPEEPQLSPEQLRPHPRSDLIPAMRAEEFADLRADIAAHGVLTPLAIDLQRVVLDGHHRLRAARELALPSVPVRLVEVADPLEYMVRAAVRRRQLTPSQLAAVAVELAAVQELRAQARARSRANLLPGSEVATLPPRGERTREFAARLVHVSPRTVQDAATVHAADPELFEQVKAGVVVAHAAAQQVRRQARYAAIGEPPPLPAGRFQLIYADPPWQLGSPCSDYAPEDYYPTLPLAEIKALEMPAAEEALLFLWAVNSLLPEALEVIEAWGFDYKTNFVWVKDWIGLGVWTRPRHELLLVGRRGAFPPAAGPSRVDSVIEAKRGRHSEKPACVYELLEQMYPRASKVELFARGKPRPGWTAWGNEVEPG